MTDQEAAARRAELLNELQPLIAVIARVVHEVPTRPTQGGADQLINELAIDIALHIQGDLLHEDARALLAKPPRPAEHGWQIETHNGERWRAWSAGVHDDHDIALEEYAYQVTRKRPPGMRGVRLIRSMTSYAVEAEHTFQDATTDEGQPDDRT